LFVDKAGLFKTLCSTQRVFLNLLFSQHTTNIICKFKAFEQKARFFCIAIAQDFDAFLFYAFIPQSVMKGGPIGGGPAPPLPQRMPQWPTP